MTSAAGGEVERVVSRMVALFSPLPIESVATSDDFIDSLQYDSMRFVELLATLEEIFAADVLASEEVLSATRVRDLVQYLDDEVAQGRARIPAQEDVDEVVALHSASEEAPGSA